MNEGSIFLLAIPLIVKGRDSDRVGDPIPRAGIAIIVQKAVFDK